MIDSSRSLSHGFSTKSRAPRRIASTARCTDPHAVITTTGIDASAVVDAPQQLEAFFARRGVAGVVEVDQHDVVVALPKRGHHGGRRFDQVDQVALGLEQQAQGFEHVALVVGDEETRR